LKLLPRPNICEAATSPSRWDVTCKRRTAQCDLFVFEDYPDLKIPNTTNALDCQFADLKNKLRNHIKVLRCLGKIMRIEISKKMCIFALLENIEIIWQKLQ